MFNVVMCYYVKSELIREGPMDQRKKAEFHWAEGNKFALEFCKSMFLFNSTISAALIAYIANQESKSIAITSDQMLCILAFLTAAVLAIATFGLGYFINLQHGNACQKSDSTQDDTIWDMANKIQLALYVLFFLIFSVIGVGLKELTNFFPIK